MLRKILQSMMEKPKKDVTNSELSRICNVDDATFSNFFSYKRDLSIPIWILSIKHLNPSRENEVLDLLVPDTIKSEDREKCRHLMEYTSTRRRLDLLETIVDSQEKAPRENKDWAKVYRISLHYQRRDKSNAEILSMLDSYSPKFTETKAFYLILKARVYYMLKEYKSMFRVALEAEKEINKICSLYIKENYLARLNELYAHAYLYLRNDVKKARYYANVVINSRFLCANFHSHMYHLLGTSFLFESYEESHENFLTYYNLLQKQGRHDLAKETLNLDIYFCKVLWGKLLGTIETNDPIERMHYLARIGDKKEFNELYNKTNKNDPFILCYKGIIENDPESLQESLLEFINSGNKFFAELPKKELEIYPAYSASTRVLSKINIA